MSVSNGGQSTRDRWTAPLATTVSTRTPSGARAEFFDVHLVKRMFPDLIRYACGIALSSLPLLLVWEMDQAGLSGGAANRIAFEFLERLSTGVDGCETNSARIKPAQAGQRLFADYC